jgi:hypothetical protein
MVDNHIFPFCCIAKQLIYTGLPPRDGKVITRAPFIEGVYIVGAPIWARLFAYSP